MAFFTEETEQRIRFLQFKIKQLEEALKKDEESITLDDLNLVLEYTMILNMNYQDLNHKKVRYSISLMDPFERKVFLRIF